MAENGNGARRGVSIYRATDAVDINSTDFMGVPQMSDGAIVGLGDAIVEGAGAGAKVMILARQSDDEGGFSLLHVWFKANYPLPRHSHDSDCMYYVISGEAIMGNQTLRAGDSFFVPADAPVRVHRRARRRRSARSPSRSSELRHEDPRRIGWSLAGNGRNHPRQP